ncbi:MAG: hypothetical protein QM485_13150 [Flavobacteriaceae bacterium]
MRYLLISIALLLVSCGTYSKRNHFKESFSSTSIITNPYFSDTSKDYVYKADISLYNRSFSGLFIVKKIGYDHHRLVFTTEMGNTIFDFSFEGRNFKINTILEGMNKKIITNVLRKDFKILLQENIRVKKTYSLGDTLIFETGIDREKYYYFKAGKQLQKIIYTNNRKEKAAFMFSNLNEGFAKNIQILHKNIKLSITLKAI